MDPGITLSDALVADVRGRIHRLGQSFEVMTGWVSHGISILRCRLLAGGMVLHRPELWRDGEAGESAGTGTPVYRAAAIQAPYRSP